MTIMDQNDDDGIVHFSVHVRIAAKDNHGVGHGSVHSRVTAEHDDGLRRFSGLQFCIVAIHNDRIALRINIDDPNGTVFTGGELDAGRSGPFFLCRLLGFIG